MGFNPFRLEGSTSFSSDAAGHVLWLPVCLLSLRMLGKIRESFY